MNYKILLLTKQPIHNYYYNNLDFLNVKMTCFGASRVAVFLSKCKTLVKLEALTPHRTCDAGRTTAVLYVRLAFVNSYPGAPRYLYLTGKSCYRPAPRPPLSPMPLPELTLRLLEPIGVFFSTLKERASMILS